MEKVHQLLQALEAWPLAEWLRSSLWAYPVLNALHILAIAMLLGGIMVLDARLLGFRARTPVEAVARAAWPFAVAGVGLAVATGPLLFSVKPTEYIVNPAFACKFVLLVLALANVVVFHAKFRGVLQGRTPVTTGVRVTAALSISLWLCVLMAGRFIAFF